MLSSKRRDQAIWLSAEQEHRARLSCDLIPSEAEMMRLPAGDSALRLRWLAQWHRERLAVFTASGSKSGASRHRKRLRMVPAIAGQCGIHAISNN